jgi:hypothetical protein
MGVVSSIEFWGHGQPSHNYNHARRLRLKKLLHTELPRSPSGFFKPPLDPGGGFRSETAVTKPFRKWSG